MTKHSTLRTLLSIAVRRSLYVKHINVKSVYLPSIWSNRRAITTGLRRRYACWNVAFTGWNNLDASGIRKYRRNWNGLDTNHPGQILVSTSGVMSFILLYVDNMLVASPDIDEYERVYRYLSKDISLRPWGTSSITWAFKWRGRISEVSFWINRHTLGRLPRGLAQTRRSHQKLPWTLDIRTCRNRRGNHCQTTSVTKAWFALWCTLRYASDTILRLQHQSRGARSVNPPLKRIRSKRRFRLKTFI